MSDEMATGVVTWWVFLVMVSAANLGMWRHSARLIERAREATSNGVYRVRRVQLMLSAVFVAGCAFRSVFPRADVQRIVLVDTWLSSVFVGRSVATLAELAFTAQWALLLYVMGKKAGSTLTLQISRVLLPLIVFAECASWYAVLTTNFLGNVVEQSSWTLGALLVVVGLLAMWPQVDSRTKRFIAATSVVGSAYIAFMINVDVYMYFTRWQADQAAGVAYLGWQQGLIDAAARWVVAHAWEPWQDEVAWMALYFSVGVWLSIFMAHVPVPRRASPQGAH